MSSYYVYISTMVIFSMFSMVVCVNSSGTLTRNHKKYFRLLFINISVAAFCECFGIYLQGTGSATYVLHLVVKAVELSIAPAIAFLIVAVIEQQTKKTVIIFLLFNCCLEVLSAFFGFIYKVDTNSVYTHEQYYWIYVASFIISILYAVVVFVRNMKKYQYNGMAYFFLITLFMLFGIIVQLCDSNLKVVYVAVAITALMLYVFTLEMILQSDELTGLINRRGYENSIAHLDEKCVVLMFDVDCFKLVNDQYGHKTGDQCLKEVGKALSKTYMNYGKCYRIGGDEFCVIVKKNADQIEQINQDFFDRIEQCRKEFAWMPWISIGYVFFDPQMDNIQETLIKVDKQMYQFKEAHRMHSNNADGDIH